MSAKICRRCGASAYVNDTEVVMMTKTGPAWFCSPEHAEGYRPWLHERFLRFRLRRRR